MGFFYTLFYFYIMRIIIFIFCLFIFTQCDNNDGSKTNQVSIKADSTISATSSKYLENDQEKEIIGDLDNDKIEEKIEIEEIKIEGEDALERVIAINKKENDKWILWKKYKGAILSSNEGGMMGDPFQGLVIKKNCIVIDEYGGSSSKWGRTLTFRYQNGDFELIGFTSVGVSNCLDIESYDYNLSNGVIEYSRDSTSCEGNNAGEVLKTIKEKYKHKISKLPLMEGFEPKEHNVIKLAEGREFYM
jgi:hypothetical protein